MPALPILSANQLAAFLISVAFAAGLNLYATTATLGLLARFGVVPLPGNLDVLGSWPVIGASAVLFLLELVADKIPFVDLLWNAVHTFIRVPAAAVLAYQATSTLDPQWRLGAAVLGGAVALVAHGGKTAARTAVTASPEPFSNFVLSTAEDGFAIFVTWFATRHPFIAAAIVVSLVIVLLAMVRVLIRALRGLFHRPLPEG